LDLTWHPRLSSCRAGEVRREIRGENLKAIWEPAAAQAEKPAADKPVSAGRRREGSAGAHS